MPTRAKEMRGPVFTSFLIPSVFEGVTARHLCVFYKQLEAFGRDRIGFIGERAYFQAPHLFERQGRPEWLPSWRATYGYTPPADLHGVHTRALPDGVLDARLRRVRSSWRLYRLLARRPLPELVSAVGEALDALGHVERIDAVLQFANNPSVCRAAMTRGLPVVHNEFGPLRPPQYVMTAYWDRRGVSLGSDAARRYARFRRQTVDDRVPVLHRDEILYVLRRDASVESLTDVPATYRLGIALQGEDNAQVQGIGALDLISMARQHFRAEEICIRYHPGSLARYPDSLGIPDTSSTPTGFISRCDAVLTVSSGTALEAMLLGRRAIVVGDSPLAVAAQRDVAQDAGAGRDDHLCALNFLVFGYLVPGELMFDAEYVRWRLSEPSEPAIYRHHLRWYRDRLRDAPVGTRATSGLRAAALLAAAAGPGGSSPLALFGAGGATAELVARLAADGRRVVAIFDNDPAKWGSRIGDLPITVPGVIADATVAVASTTHADAMVRQLRGLGYDHDRIVSLQ
ncbi:MAG: hypothetical protein AB7H93_18110 [Vicinamibacterales bacterium]